MDLEVEFQSLIDRYDQEGNSHQFVDHLLATLEKGKMASEGTRLSALNLAAHFLSKPDVRRRVWDWLVKESETSDDKYRIQLSIAVFELLADEPKDIEYLSLLFSLLERPPCWWVFLEIYEEKKEKFYEDLYLVVSHSGHFVK